MIAVYWDESHLWGLLLTHALGRLDVAHRCLGAAEIAAGALADLPGSLFVVPGGWARRKAALLGASGMAAVRAHVASGGSYLGLCGGAGLGLTGDGLGLCPWGRAGFDSRIQHFASGHIHVHVDRTSPLVPACLSDDPLVPVWWPARFKPVSGGSEVTILATYGAPGQDFMMADVALRNLPVETLADWESLYGVNLSPSFLTGRPCLVAGEHGRGRYVLSYAHLETPRSPEANTWLRHLLAELGGAEITATDAPVPDWDLGPVAPAWSDPILMRAAALCEEVIELGREHLLLFWRTSWLLGWRRGLPGASLNSLYAMLRECLAHHPSEAALALWRERSDDFERALMLFHRGLRGYFLAERLAMSLHSTDPGAVPARSLKEARLSLFGPMPGTGGLCGRLLEDLDQLLLALMRGR